MKIKDMPEIASLSISEKILLVEDLWDSIAETEDFPISDFHKIELNKRYEKHGNNPNIMISLVDLQSRINAKK